MKLLTKKEATRAIFELAQSVFYEEMGRKLRLAMVTNVYDQGIITEKQAKDLLFGPLTPGDDCEFNDSDLLGDPDGLNKIAAYYTGEEE